MHEFSIANSIVSTITQEMEQRNLTNLKEVGVRIGALSGVDPESLRFSFEVIIAETPFSNARLKIENIPVQGKCHTCNREFEVKKFIFICPLCDSRNIEAIHGEELDVAYLEVEDDSENA